MKIGPTPRVAAAWAQKGKDPGPPGPATPAVTVTFPDPGPGATAMRTHGASAIYVRAQSASVAVKNPLSWDDCPDPSVLRLGSDYIIASTGSLYEYRRGGPIFPLRMARGGDFNELDVLGHAIERTPPWMERDPWAPDLHHDDEMGYAITFTGRADDGRLSLGIAFADKPDGPYRERVPGRAREHDAPGKTPAGVERAEQMQKRKKK